MEKIRLTLSERSSPKIKEIFKGISEYPSLSSSELLLEIIKLFYRWINFAFTYGSRHIFS